MIYIGIVTNPLHDTGEGIQFLLIIKVHLKQFLSEQLKRSFDICEYFVVCHEVDTFKVIEYVLRMHLKQLSLYYLRLETGAACLTDLFWLCWV